MDVCGTVGLVIELTTGWVLELKVVMEWGSIDCRQGVVVVERIDAAVVVSSSFSFGFESGDGCRIPESERDRARPKISSISSEGAVA